METKDMPERMKQTIFVVVVFFIFCVYAVGVNSFKGAAADKMIAAEKERIEAKYKKDIEDLQTKITAKENELTQSKTEAADFRARLQVTEAKLRAITKPATAAEAKEKLRSMGYEVR